MREKLLIGSLIYATISASAARAQERPIGNKPLAEISYRPVGKLIYVPIQVNGSGRLWFIFDTGAPNSIIDTAAAQTLHVKSTSSGIIHGAGKGDISADDVGEVPFTFGGLTTRVPHAKIVDLSKVPVPVRADGLLGAEFLEQYVIRIDPAARRSPAGCVKLPVIDALEARETRRPAMKKLTTTMMQETLSKHDGRLTVGLDLGDRSSFYCVLDGTGDVLLEQKVSTTPRAINEIFGAMPRSRIAVETGTHSPWVSRLLSELGHETIVAHARSVRLIGESRRKDDRIDAMTLARLVRIDPQLLCPVKHRSAQAQADLTVIRARAALVRTRTMLVNVARGLTKSYGERLRGCNARGMKPKSAQDLSPELKYALEPMMHEIESASERICQYDQMLDSMARNRYPEAERLKQIKGVGTLIALTYMLTLEDPHRFRKSRDAACYVGLQPGRRNSGQSEPQMHISKEGDPYLRSLLVQVAHHVLGPWGVDSDLRRWGTKLAEHGGKRGKKRAVIAVARKLAVLLHRLWVSGDRYVPLRPSGQAALPAVA